MMSGRCGPRSSLACTELWVDLMVDPKGVSHTDLAANSCQTGCPCKKIRTEETVSLYAFALALYSWNNCRRQRLVRLSCLSRMLQQAVRLLAPRICASEGCTCHQDWCPDIQEANVVRPTNPLATGPFQSFANQLLGNIGHPTSLLALCLSSSPPFRGWRPWGWSCGRRWAIFMLALVDWRWGWHSCWLLR